LEKIRGSFSGCKDRDSSGSEGVIKVFTLERGLIPASAHRYIMNKVYRIREISCRGILLFLWSRAVRVHLMVGVGGLDSPPSAG
jgi:hypothetical protein